MSSSNARRRLVVALGLLLMLALTFGIGEVAARLLPAADGFAERMRVYGDEALEADEELGHRTAPDRAVTIGGVEYVSDELGMRPTGSDNAALPQVLVIGDSVSFGWGVDGAKAWPAVLEQHLALGDTPANVVNASIVAHGVHQYARRLDELTASDAPDVVLIGYYPNDAEPIERTMRRPLAHKSVLVRRIAPMVRSVLVSLSLSPTAEHYYRSLHAAENSARRDADAALLQIATRCEELESHCVLILLPALIGVPYPLADVHAQVSGTARSHGLEVVDLAHATDEGGVRDFWVEPDDAHPNHVAHALYAAALVDRVEELLRPGAQ